MNPFVRTAGLGVAAATLAVFPWVGAFRLADEATADARPSVARISAAPAWGSAPDEAAGGRSAGGSGGGCGCDEVVVEAINTLRDTKLRTGDAKVRNTNVIYISVAYVASVTGRIEIEVTQRADATTGDALAGQVIGPHAGRAFAVGAGAGVAALVLLGFGRRRVGHQAMADGRQQCIHAFTRYGTGEHAGDRQLRHGPRRRAVRGLRLSAARVLPPPARRRHADVPLPAPRSR